MPDTHPSVLLARAIAAEIRRLIAAGTMIATKSGTRRVHEGDFLILVQRRSTLFAEVIRACKTEGLAIAGADRLRLGAELAVRDIGALLSFLATPEDDLSLASALRSPLFGWGEQDIYSLAQGRADREWLWQAFRRSEGHPETRAILDDLRLQADFLRPFELIERLLTRHGGRQRLIARLGPEAEDGIDELLTQALAFERSEIPSLTGFLSWLSAGEVEVKRQFDSGGRAIRVMTVHGAKGLEAPIVFLPDTIRRDPVVRDAVLVLPDGTPVWATAADQSPDEIASVREARTRAQAEERDRLLYVAMTRAESWLIVCGAGDPSKGTDQWYGLVAGAMEAAGAAALPAPAHMGISGQMLRYSHEEWPADDQTATQLATAARAAIPDWARSAPALPAPSARPLSPSDLGGAKALAGRLTDVPEDAGDALRHGRQLHLLMEYFPAHPADEWPGIAAALFAGGEDAATAAETEALIADARAILGSAAFAPLLPGSLAEVPVAAHLPELGGRLVHGAIDRLVLNDDSVTAIDYKSNHIVPESPEAIPEGILRQLGAYAAILARVWPGRRIVTAVLWTGDGTLMTVPPALTTAALVRAAAELAATPAARAEVAPTRA